MHGIVPQTISFLEGGRRYCVIPTERLRWPDDARKPLTPYVLVDQNYSVVRGVSQAEYFVMRRRHVTAE